MMLDLRALKEFPARITFEENAAELDLKTRGLNYLDKARVELDVVKSAHVYYCNGQVAVDVEFECSRCLEYYRDRLVGEIDFSIRQNAEAEPVDREEVPETQIIIAEDTGGVDISDPIREALILELPLKPLCSEDCRGLCPQCGINRNEQKCQCKLETTDSRWDGLRELL